MGKAAAASPPGGVPGAWGKCGVVAGEEEKPGAVKTAEAQAGVPHP